MQKITDKRYVQKSKVFLLPLINLKKDLYVKPIKTFIIDKVANVTVNDRKLILPFFKDNSSEFNYYENNHIMTCDYLDVSSYYETDKFRVYSFKLNHIENDFDLFLEGKYTKFSKKTKSLIHLYWGKLKKNNFYPHPKIEAYLYPNLEIYKQVAEELNLPLEMVIETEELLDPPNLNLEELHIESIKYSKEDQEKIEN